MDRYDHIEEVEVEKFNPFHDSAGKFSSSNGFKTYSANPNTRAGAMAISRSAAAGHMNTVNVHRAAQSTGTTIRQNANWLGQGHQQTRGQTASATLNRRIEPANGLGGASQAGALWQRQNQLQGRHTQVSNPKKQPKQNQQQNQQQTQNQQQAQQKPAAQQKQPAKPQNQPGKGLDAQTQGVTLSTGDKLAIQPRDRHGHTTTATKNLAQNHDQEHVVGKDISKTADLTRVNSNKAPIDQMADLQGWNKKPTVTDNLETFQKAAKQSGTLMIRTVSSNGRTGQSADDVCKETMTNADAALGGHGGKVYGSGMYMVGAQTNNKTGRDLGRQIAVSQTHSALYGERQMIATIHPKAKIATPTKANQLRREFNNLSYGEQRKFGDDYGAYIASKGYDGARWHTRANPYITMYNKSALIFYSGVTDVT